MLHIKDLSISFGKTKAVNSISISFDEGKIHGIIGLNGAGKTTFFNLLSSFLKPDSGSILKNEKALSRNDIAYLETVNFFYSNITGDEYLAIFPTTNKNFNLDEINTLLQLPLNEIVETYSTGMKKKLALLAILKQDKPIYIFDEPFNGLDMETSRVLEIVIENLKAKGKTIFISSHILSPLTDKCDEIHLLEAGQFRKTYGRNDFKNIESELFADFNAMAKSVVQSAI